jgi:hypothetical protein
VVKQTITTHRTRLERLSSTILNRVVPPLSISLKRTRSNMKRLKTLEMKSKRKRKTTRNPRRRRMEPLMMKRRRRQLKTSLTSKRK